MAEQWSPAKEFQLRPCGLSTDPHRLRSFSEQPLGACDYPTVGDLLPNHACSRVFGPSAPERTLLEAIVKQQRAR